MIRHRVTAASVSLVLLLTAACTSSGKKHSTTSSTTGSTAGTPAARSLSESLHTALSTLSSAAITIDAGGLIATTTGHIKLADGHSTASEYMIGTGAEGSHVIVVGNDAFAALPAGQNTSGKPYIKVSANSGNEFVRGLAENLQILEATASLGDLADLVSTASAFTDKGAAAGGTHEYTFSISGDAHGSVLQQQVAELGSDPVGVDLFVNGQKLPVKVVLQVKIAGSTLPVTATLSNFNAPVTITAPPANQVTNG